VIGDVACLGEAFLDRCRIAWQEGRVGPFDPSILAGGGQLSRSVT
jgi:hypothetical protein